MDARAEVRRRSRRLAPVRSIAHELINPLADLLRVKLAVLVAQVGELRRQPDVGGVLQSVACDALDLTAVLRVDTRAELVALLLGAFFAKR